MSDLFSPLSFRCGATMKNRFMLAPLTNSQSHEDGTLSDDEFRWLTLRAVGGFGLTMTCATHVQAVGKGFPGQLGLFGEEHVAGHARLAAAIQAEGSLAVVQLHHAGNRSPADLIGTQPVCPSEDAETGARALSTSEVEALRDDFIAAAVRAQAAGYDGVELHGAHGYILCQFLSPELNRRTDDFGGSAENRARLLLQIIDGVRERCGPGFLLGVRLSPERFGVDFEEMLALTQQLFDQQQLDFLDASLWSCFKEPADERFAGKSLLAWFAALDRKDTRLTPAGKLYTGQDCARAMAEGTDFVTLGRAAILHHDYPLRMAADRNFVPAALPVSRAHLRQEGLSDTFIAYMNNWKGFVADDQASA
ncbi:MAG: NADH:flavin oxidoreductase [Pseudomonadota bacterium]